MVNNIVNTTTQGFINTWCTTQKHNVMTYQVKYFAQVHTYCRNRLS